MNKKKLIRTFNDYVNGIPHINEVIKDAINDEFEVVENDNNQFLCIGATDEESLQDFINERLWKFGYCALRAEINDFHYFTLFDYFEFSLDWHFVDEDETD